MTAPVNPYLTYRAELRGGIYFVPSPTYERQLDALAGIYAASLGIVFLGLALRLRTGRFSMGQIVKTPAGSWVVPHQVNTWLVASAIGYVLVQPFIWVSRSAGQEGADLMNIELWRSVAWYPIIGGGWCACWAVAVATLIPRDPSYHPSWRDQVLGPIIVTSFYLGCPILFCAVDFAYNFRANQAFNAGFMAFIQLDALLGEAALGQAVDFASLGALGTVISDRYALGLALTISARYAQAVMISLLILVYSLSVIVMLTNLSASLSRTRSSTSLTVSKWWTRPDTLSFQFRMQVFAFIASVVFAGLYLILDIVLNVSFTQGLTGGITASNVTEVGTLAALWIQATIGTLVNASLLLRTFLETPPLSNRQTVSKLMTQDESNSSPAWDLEKSSKDGLNGNSPPLAMGMVEFLNTGGGNGRKDSF